MRDKNLAKSNYLKSIEQSWTWARLTQEEKEKFIELLDHPCSGIVLRGTYDQRWQACDALYYTFLIGLGYSPLDWRDNQPTVSTFYELNYKTYGKQVKPLQITDKTQAKKLARAARNQAGNKEVYLTKVNITTTRVEVV